MQIETQDFLRLSEGAGTLCFFDIETNNLNADYGEVLVISYKLSGKAVKTLSSDDMTERAMLKEFRRVVAEEADCIVSYNGKRFDVPFINTRLLEYGEDPLAKKHHLDYYFTLKYQLRLGRKSLGVIGGWLRLDEKKMTVHPSQWREKHYPTLRARCKSDVELLEQLHGKTKHLVREISR